MDWKKIVQTVAPGLATALGGPMAGIAARGIADALLGPGEADQTAIEQAVLQASPEDLRKLKQAEHVFQSQMKELQVDLEKLHATDRASARDRQMKTGDLVPGFIAAAALLGFFGILVAMVFTEIPSHSQAPLDVMLGALGSLVVGIGNYYFGSSAGSSAKNELIADLMTGRSRSQPHHGETHGLF